MNEDDWIKRITERFDDVSPHVAVGIGDDAAVLSLPPPTVVSVDAAVEGIHFQRAWASAAALGRRAYVAALSDLAAMGARPSTGLLSMVFPSDEEAGFIDGLLDGFAAAAEEYRAPICGGNLSRGEGVVLSTTVLGTPVGQPVCRSGAQPGDTVFLTGPVGQAALGWRILSDGGPRDEVEATIVARWQHPRARFDWVERLSACATAAIDISDGLAKDLGHLCKASKVGALIEPERLPLSAAFREAAMKRSLDAEQLALGGGEDYELLFTANSSEAPVEDATAIGTVVKEVGVRLVDREGRALTLPEGYSHF